MAPNKFVLLSLLVLGGCIEEVRHSTAEERLRPPATDVVATVGERGITAEELRLEIAETGATPQAAVDALVEREILVQAALARGEGARKHPVKAAAVRTLIEDEIETKTTAENTPKVLVDAASERAFSEMSRPEGFEVTAISVFVPKTVEGRTPTDAELEQWKPLARSEAERIRDWLAEDPSPARARQFAISTLKSPISASARPSMTVAHPDEIKRIAAPDGWTPNRVISEFAAGLADGQVGVAETDRVYYVIARYRQIERVVPEPDAVRKRAAEIARDELRRSQLDAFVSNLRNEAAVEIFPATIERAAQGAQVEEE